MLSKDSGKDQQEAIGMDEVISKKNTGDLFSDLSNIFPLMAKIINNYISANYSIDNFLDPSLLFTLVDNLNNNNYTKSLFEEGNKIITKYVIPYLPNDKTIITTYFDKLSNILFYELPSEFNNFINDKISVSLFKDLDDSVIGKFQLTLPLKENIKNIVPFTFALKPNINDLSKADISFSMSAADKVGNPAPQEKPESNAAAAVARPAIEQGEWSEAVVLVEDPTNPLSLYKEFYASAPYADVYFKANNYVMFIKVIYKNLDGLSAFHIHVNNNGSPGPILAWLGTTIEWQNGVAQNGVNSNSPCCTKQNKNCSLIAPPGTPYLNEIKVPLTQKFVVYNENIGLNSSCPWINNGTLLDFHGLDFQQEYDGKLTAGVPGADLIFQATFQEVFVNKNTGIASPDGQASSSDCGEQKSDCGLYGECQNGTCVPNPNL